ncbi:hypothetical protein AVEN_130308-1 [Araneus ventricosus]|uniref:Uncharacterized protein n=1 Tax=Araneus ventricosus TaxID=182803 RepID=A0A4Y2BCZ2_ARAVE|nr:hypothetical protein AVEN_130308-1 [Araneus ventricosus]
MDGATSSLQHSLPSRASCYTGGLSLGGNEAADLPAKKATQEGIATFIPAPRNHIKSLLQKESIIRWQKEWDNGETGRSVHNLLPKVKTTPTPCQRPEIIFVTGHFRHILKDSTSEEATPVAAETWETPYTMLQIACLQHHTTQQNRQLT